MFKPGDRVICVNDVDCKLFKGRHYTIKEIHNPSLGDESSCVLEEVHGFFWLNRFKPINFVPPQESPPTYSCIGAGGGASDPADVVHGSNGKTHMSSGGPYIASSVYNELKKQNEELEAELVHVKRNYVARYDELTDMQTKIKELEEQIAAANKPQFVPPPYIKSGWWIAMDANGAWWVFERKPTVDMQCLEWSYGGSAHELPIITGTDESMWHVPNDQWQQTLLQIP